MKITDFDYTLPPDSIAQQPLADRDASRLMVLERRTGAVRHHVFRDLPDLLAPGDLLVVNRSKVFPARLLAQRAQGGAAEVLLVRPLADARWSALLRPGRRLRAGTTLRVAVGLDVLVEDGAPDADGCRPVRLVTRDGLAPEEAVERWGHVPLPPYIHRPDTEADRERYQVIYARERGSVAAPTAGLHFTENLLHRLQQRGIERAELVLHVGPGTFRPVKADDVAQHRVDAEPYFVPPETAQAVAHARARGARVVAVGTTTTRALESAALADGGIRSGAAQTDLVITPGFEFRVIDALVTNFHLPRSSLLLLLAAFGGRERVLAAYAEAVQAGYRFYSYGDAMLVL